MRNVMYGCCHFHFTSLYFPSLHFTSLHFTAICFNDSHPQIHLALFIAWDWTPYYVKTKKLSSPTRIVIYKEDCMFYMNGNLILHENDIPQDPNGHIANRKRVVIYNVSLLWTAAFSLEGASICFYRYLRSIGVIRRQVPCINQSYVSS
jgi:hypothetical protein